MPTGYTSDLYNGPVDFADFLWSGARAMGALHSMRDEPMDAPISLTSTSTSNTLYHQTRLDEATESLEKLKAMSDDEIQAQLEKSHQESLNTYILHLSEVEERSARYHDMEAQIKAWDPPTPDHTNLKEFMLGQIQTSREYDCTSSFIPLPIQTSVQEYKNSQTIRYELNISYHRNTIQTQDGYAQIRTKWLQDLHASVPCPNLAPVSEPIPTQEVT